MCDIYEKEIYTHTKTEWNTMKKKRNTHPIDMVNKNIAFVGGKITPTPAFVIYPFPNQTAELHW